MLTTFLCTLLAAWAPLPKPADPVPPDKLKVVCTIADLADMVREIGGDRVEVQVIARGRENLHAVMVRPSNIVAMSRADMFVQIGLSLETAFVPALLSAARNTKIEPGKPGFCNCSQGFDPLDKPVTLSRRNGDVHPQGNPHMNMDPRAGKLMAENIFDSLCGVDPDSKGYYEQRYKAYDKRLDEAFARWSVIGKQLAGKPIVVYHKEYDYLADCWGMKIVDAIEVRPGIPPTPNHIAEVIDEMKKAGCKIILSAVWSNNGDTARVAEEAGAKIVELPNQCGGMPDCDTWIGMMDFVMKSLGEAFGVTGAPQ